MLRTPVLLDEQINDFHRDGYVVVRGAFGAAEMPRIEAWARELAELTGSDRGVMGTAPGDRLAAKFFGHFRPAIHGPDSQNR